MGEEGDDFVERICLHEVLAELLVEFEFCLDCLFDVELNLGVIDFVFPEVGDEAVDWFEGVGKEVGECLGEGERVVEGERHAVFDDGPEGEQAGQFNHRMRYLMRADLVMGVLLIEEEISYIRFGREVQYVEIMDVLWVVLEQEHEVVILEVVDLKVLDGLLHVVLELCLLLLAQHVPHLLRQLMQEVDDPEVEVSTALEPTHKLASVVQLGHRDVHLQQVARNEDHAVDVFFLVHVAH